MGRNKLRKTFFSKNVPIPGKCLIEARALGGRIHYQGSNIPERGNRRKAILAAYYQ